MRRTAKRLANMLALFALCITFGLCVLACGETPEPAPDPIPDPPVKVSDGIDFDIAIGKSRNLSIADYITANGNTVTAQSDSANASATVDQGLLTVTGVSEGSATVTLACEDISVTFAVTVYTEYTVTVDGTATSVRKGGSFTLPAAPAIDDENMEFDHWLVGEEQKDPGETITVVDNMTIVSVTKRKAAVKVKDGEAVSATAGEAKAIVIADYITAYGATVTAESDDEDILTVDVADGKVQIAPVAEGTAVITVTCGSITIEFTVTVSPAPPATYTVTVDGEVAATLAAGSTYTLPAAPTVSDPDYEFVGWNVNGAVKQPAEVITVNGNVVITKELERKAAQKVSDGIIINLSVDDEDSAEIVVSDYIITHGGEVEVSSQNTEVATAALGAGKVTVTAVASGNTTVTLACDSVTVTFTVNVTSAADGTPVFKNGTISFDLFETNSGSYAFRITEPEGSDFSYSYTVTPNTGVSISGNTLTYTSEATVSNLVLTVNVTATDATLGEKTTSFSVTVNVTDTTPVVNNSAITVQGVKDLYDGELVVDLAANIDNAQNVTSYKVNGEAVEGTTYEITGSYSDAPTEKTITVQAIFGANGERAVSYTYTVNVIDSTDYRIANGGFDGDDHGAGWTGMTGRFDNNPKYFANAETGFEGYDSNNDGWYYIGVDEGTETIYSPEFKVGNSGWVTFKLGSMRPYEGNVLRGVYLTVEEKGEDDSYDSIARLSNVLFKDPERALRLNAYKLDLSAYIGQTMRFVIYDEEDGGNFRSIYLDSFNTWWDEDPGADYTDLTGMYVLDCEISIDLKDKNTGAIEPVVYSKGLFSNAPVGTVRDNVDGITLGTGEDLDKFTVTKTGTYYIDYTLNDKPLYTVTIVVTNSTELPTIDNIEKTYEYSQWHGETANTQAIADMPVPAEGSNLSYDFTVTNVTGGATAENVVIEGGKLKYTPADVSTIVITVETTVKDTRYDPDLAIDTVTFTVTLRFLDNVISLKNGETITLTHDVNDLSDKEKLVLEFADYVNVPSEKVGNTTYAAKLGGEDITLSETSKYTVTFANKDLSDTAKQYVFAITATEGSTVLNYTVTLNLTDTYQYRVQNGGFDNDLDGWTLSNPALGGVYNVEYYWNEHVAFNADGKFFNAYTILKEGDPTVAMEGNEGATGTLTSSTFKVGGSGWITYKLGGAKNIDVVYAEVVRASDSKAVKLPNFDWSNADKKGCSLRAYKVNLLEYCGFEKNDEVFIRFNDEAGSDYGLFFVDSVVTYYTQEPGDEYSLVTKYKLYNGGFEMGDYGWTRTEGDQFAAVTDDSKYFSGDDYGKDGECLLSGAAGGDHGNNPDGMESNMGVLRSSNFILKKNAWISFKLGGGNYEQIGIRIVKADGTVLASFNNTAMKAAEGVLVQYVYHFTGMTEDVECYVEIFDQQPDGAWRLLTVDSIITYYAAAPPIDGAVDVTPQAA